MKPYVDRLEEIKPGRGGITSNFGADFGLGALGSAMDEQIKKTYEGDAVQSALAEQAKNIIVNSETGATAEGQLREQKVKFLLSTGDIPPQTFIDLMGGLTGKEAAQQNDFMLNIVSNLGTAEGGQILQMAAMIKDPEKRADFQLLFQGDAEQAQKYSDLFSKISEFGGAKAVEIVSQKSTEELDKLAKSYQTIDDLTANGPVTMETVVNLDPSFSALKDQAEYFNSLPAAQQKVFLQRYLTVYDTVSPAEATQWMAEQMGGTSVAFRRSEAGQPMFTQEQAMQAYAANSAREFTNALNLGSEFGGDAGVTDGGGGGGRSEEHTSELQSLRHLVCRLLLVKKKECASRGTHRPADRAAGDRSNVPRHFLSHCAHDNC